MKQITKKNQIVSDLDGDQMTAECLAIYIAKVCSGNYNFQGIRSITETAGMSKLANKYLKGAGKNIVIVEVEEGHGRSEYKPTFASAK
jgi:hypothetical protein